MDPGSSSPPAASATAYRARSISVTGAVEVDRALLPVAPHKMRMSVDTSPRLQQYLHARGAPLSPGSPSRSRARVSSQSQLAVSRSLAAPQLRTSRLRSMARTIAYAQVTGRPHFHSLRSLPRSFQKHLNKAHDDFPQLLLQISRALDDRRWLQLKTNVIQLCKALTETPDPREALQHAVLFDAPLVLKHLLFIEPRLSDGTDTRSLITGVQNEALTVLREVCYTSAHVSESLALDDRFVLRVLHLLRNNHTFDNAVAVAESVLAARPSAFDLALVPALDDLVRGFSTRQLAFFCRVLALVVYEPEDRVQSTKYLESVQQRQLSVRATDRNQAMLIGMPDLLPRLVMLLRAQNVPVTMWTEQIMSHFSRASDLLNMLVGMDEEDDWRELEAQHATRLNLTPAQAEVAGDPSIYRTPVQRAATPTPYSIRHPLPTPSPTPGPVPTLSMPTTDAAAVAHGAGVGPLLPRTGAAVQDQYREQVLFAQMSDDDDDDDDDDDVVDGVPVSELSVHDVAYDGPHMRSETAASVQARFAAALAGARGDDSDQEVVEEVLEPETDVSELDQEVANVLQRHRAAVQIAGGALSDLDLEPDSDDDDDEVAAEDGADEEDGEANPLLSLKALTLASHQVEIMFVLCNLLGGKRKAEVQDMLANLGVVPVLESMWNTLAWDKVEQEQREHDPLHGAGCQCNPHSALRVQFLRLIHNFCDRDCDNRENRRLLFTASEMAQVFGGDATQHTSPMRCQSRGLLRLLIDQLLAEAPDSNYRFWLASCVESFLRGSSPEEQVFVARSGLLKHLLDDLTGDGFKTSGANQTSFDLLGEIMKFNPDVFAMVNATLDDSQYAALLRTMVSNLVDSNVFVRSLLLSLEHFRVRNAQIAAGLLAARPYPVRDCKLNVFIEKNGFQLLRDLMTVVSVDDISQENICCLNTTLIFFIYGRRRAVVPKYLAAIRSAELSSGSPGRIIGNFGELLAFWRQYYTHRNKDCLSLEFSSRIRFAEWRATVDALAGPASSPESLAYAASLAPPPRAH